MHLKTSNKPNTTSVTLAAGHALGFSLTPKKKRSKQGTEELKLTANNNKKGTRESDESIDHQNSVKIYGGKESEREWMCVHV